MPDGVQWTRVEEIVQLIPTMKSVGAAAAKKAEAKVEVAAAAQDAESVEEAPAGDNNGFFTPERQDRFLQCKGRAAL